MIDNVDIGVNSAALAELLASSNSISSSGNQVEVVGEAEEHQPKEDAIIPISNIRSLINQDLKINIPEGIISESGIKEIIDYLHNTYSGLGRLDWASLAPPAESSVDFEWKWLDPKKGNLPKRLRRWLKKRLKMEPDPTILAEVGNIARSHSTSSADYFFTITDKIDWSSTQFGQADNGSCWWSRGANGHWDKPNDNSYAYQFLEEGGLAVKFFSTDEDRSNRNGIGRLWIMAEPTKQEWMLGFNGYLSGQGATLTLSRVLATYLGLGYLKVKVKRNGQRYYINGDMGYYIGDQGLLQHLPIVGLVVPRVVPMEQCSGCYAIVEKSSIQSLNNHSYCNGCYYAYSVECRYCGVGYHRLETTMSIVVIKHRSGCIAVSAAWCPSCVANYARLCPGSCGRLLYTSNYNSMPSSFGTDASGNRLYCCIQCLATIPRCRTCKQKTIMTDAMGTPYCSRCQDNFEEEIRLPSDNEIYWMDNPRPTTYYDRDMGGCQCYECVEARETASRRATPISSVVDVFAIAQDIDDPF